MNSNHLIIGLGGTGGKVIRSFRKRVYETYRMEDPEGVNIRYLYVDSSNEMMSADDPSWQILGQSVQLQKNSQLLIRGLDLSHVLDNVSSYPGIAPWIGGKEQFRNILNSANAANVVGGQKRRLGRFLFACRVMEFREQVKQLVKEMETGGAAAVTFHVCCGLAGGTGSGSIVDAVSQIRSMFPGKSYRILIYTQLPDRFPAANRAGANYHSNGYAALLELNGLSTGTYQPYDISGETSGRLNLQDPFNCCYLYSDENEDHNRVDLDQQLPEIVASFLYEKIVTNEKLSWSSLRRLETFENMDFRPEESPDGHRPERSRLFFTFGVKQVAYPEEEIREFLTYSFARQAALQLLYNRWSDDFGFSDEPANISFSERVRSPEAQHHWYLTDERLQLSEGILPDEIRNKRWKPITQFWMDLIPNLKIHVRETHRKNEAVWLDELQKLCDLAFAQNYRDLGVRKFYEAKCAELRNHVIELRTRIELQMFQEWSNGAIALWDATKIASALIVSLEERLQTLGDKSARARENEASVAAKLHANLREWVKLGPLSKALGKSNAIFDAQGEILQQLYIIRTRIEALEFQKRLMQSLIGELGSMAADLGRANSLLAESLKAFTSGVQERCTDQGKVELNGHIVRFYDPQAVKLFVRTLLLDHPEQQKMTAAVRAAITQMLGDTMTFSALLNRLGRKGIVTALETTCEEMAVAAHNNAVASTRTRGRILGVSIVERMEREFEGNPDNLRRYIEQVVSRAKNNLCFSDAEVHRKGPGLVADSIVSQMAILLPEAPENAEFRERLCTEFTNAKPGAKEIVPTAHRRNEITLISLTSLFPLRFVADVAFLRDRYRARLEASNAGQAAMELHSEAAITELPDLFIEEVSSAKLLGNLLLGEAMNVVRVIDDPQSGDRNLYLVPRDHRGRDRQPRILGKDFRAVVDAGELTQYDALSSAVKALLSTEALHVNRRRELLNSVEITVDSVIQKTGSPLDRTSQLYAQALDVAEQILGLQ